MKNQVGQPCEECGLLELGGARRAAFWLLKALRYVPHCDVTDAIVAAL